MDVFINHGKSTKKAMKTSIENAQAACLGTEAAEKAATSGAFTAQNWMSGNPGAGRKPPKPMEKQGKKVEKHGKKVGKRWDAIGKKAKLGKMGKSWRNIGNIWENHEQTWEKTWKDTHTQFTEELGVGGGEHLNIRRFISDPENHRFLEECSPPALYLAGSILIRGMADIYDGDIMRFLNQDDLACPKTGDELPNSNGDNDDQPVNGVENPQKNPFRTMKRWSILELMW